MIGLLRKLARAEHGATAVEYGLICAMIVLAAMGAIGTFGMETTEMWNEIRDEVLAH